MEFEWDAVKAMANEEKHGISFWEAASCFWDPQVIIFYDPDHSYDEDREILIGYSKFANLLLVVHTARGEATRIISARKATKKEARLYAEGI